MEILNIYELRVLDRLVKVYNQVIGRQSDDAERNEYLLLFSEGHSRMRRYP